MSGRNSAFAAIGALAVALVALLPASAQEMCLRPPDPYPYPPPQDDPELYAFINAEYRTYMLAMQDYLNCLGDEHVTASREVKEVLDRWVEYFGDDAGLQLDMLPEDEGAPRVN